MRRVSHLSWAFTFDYIMSLTLTLTGTTSILTTSYFPALDLSNGEYELGYEFRNVQRDTSKCYFHE